MNSIAQLIYKKQVYTNSNKEYMRMEKDKLTTVLCTSTKRVIWELSGYIPFILTVIIVVSTIVWAVKEIK